MISFTTPPKDKIFTHNAARNSDSLAPIDAILSTVDVWTKVLRVSSVSNTVSRVHARGELPPSPVKPYLEDHHGTGRQKFGGAASECSLLTVAV